MQDAVYVTSENILKQMGNLERALPCWQYKEYLKATGDKWLKRVNGTKNYWLRRKQNLFLRSTKSNVYDL